jgi:N-acetylglucosamine kinase-like BadF-type ATPase
VPTVIGIDAGGTKTLGLLADESGEVLAEARAGGANLHVHGELGVEKVLYRVMEALESPEPVAAVCVGIAGVDRPEDRIVILEILRRLGVRESVQVVHDAAIALVAGSPERTGIVVVSGTGSIAYGVDASGANARSGGWGYLLADEGSAFWLGQEALRRCVRAVDGRGVATTLVERVVDRLGVEIPGGLVAWVYDIAQVRYRIAELAPLVQEAANGGDATAGALLEEAAEHLATAARAVAGRLAFEAPFRLVLSGGAFRACPGLAARIQGCLDLPAARVELLETQPAHGAVTLARDLLTQSYQARRNADR